VALESEEALTAAEVKQYLRRSHELVLQKRTKKARAGLSGGRSG
jgi:predicted DNA-binding protein (MmcQ/YjbR family)